MDTMNDEKNKDRCICECGNDIFIIYITITIADARFYCTKCEKSWSG